MFNLFQQPFQSADLNQNANISASTVSTHIPSWQRDGRLTDGLLRSNKNMFEPIDTSSPGTLLGRIGRLIFNRHYNQ